MKRIIPGTYLLSGENTGEGYALNKMCFSFNSETSRKAFTRNQEAYCRKYGLSEKQIRAILDRDLIGLQRTGGNIYYLGKYAGLLGLDVQDWGAMQTGKSKTDFTAMLYAAGAA
ncbi:MAG: protocatechuate 3,4-dioxygenase [Pseudomonadota bacterium]